MGNGMAVEKGASGLTGVVIPVAAASVAAVAAAAGWFWWQGQGGGTPPAPAPAPAPLAALPAAPAPAVSTEVAATPKPVPAFDNWRVDADGSAVVAGRTGGGERIAVLVDGAVVAEVAASAGDSFAAVFTLSPNDQPSLMSLEARFADGSRVPSDQTVALAPIAGPAVTVAQAEATVPDPAPAEVAPPPATLLLSPDGVEVVAAAEPPPPGDVAGVLLDSIAYVAGGAVQLGGRGQAAQLVRIYLDNAPAGEAPVPDTGRWQAILGDVAPGLYTLRLDQIDGAGAVTARFETPFRRETAEALAALSTPAPQAPVSVPVSTPVPPSVPLPDQAAALREPAPLVPTATPTVPPDAAADAGPVLTPTTEAPAPATAAPAAPIAPDAVPAVTITVQPGFTLWGIARERFGDGVLYVQVYEANRDKIRNPDLIYPGQVFALPGAP